MLAHTPKQNIFSGMPMTLLPEEVTLLVEKNFAKVVQLKDPANPPTQDLKDKYAEYLEKVNKEQVESYEEERKKRVLSMIDIIVEGKKRKLMKQLKQRQTTGDTIEIDREAILNSEMQRGSVTHTPYVQTFTEDPWYKENDFTPADWNFPSTKEDKLKYEVFKNLWEKDYYVTPGQKFGGDYLIYPGDPVKFHAFAIVQCRDHTDPIPMVDLIAHSRIGSTTRKTFVIASQREDGEIAYHSVRLGDLS
ncbi:hypothetical protein AAG570_005898 [Ranatra chinensis]|uniref:tRNA-splicing endonuclease subunit Sen34 n=1 Tax=Ranatra chinensis TaxID=642074 RepID=A0ABD0Y9F2_9HEMI